MKSTSHLERLPPTFSVRQAALSLGVPARTATVYLDKWKRMGLVATAGGRSGWWHNLGKNPGCTWSCDTILPIFRTATLIGASVLHACGVTTQIPRELHLAIAWRRSYPTLRGLALHGRPHRWFLLHRADFVFQKDVDWNTLGLRALAPAAALLDLYATPGAWHPDPDDLDIDSIRDDINLRLPTGADVPWQLKELGVSPRQAADWRPESRRRIVVP